MLEQFDTVRALLEEVGWGNTERTIDVERHRRPLVSALESRLRLDRYFVADPATSPASREATERDIAGVEGFLSAAGLSGGQ
jgi:hypothetical protein